MKQRYHLKNQAAFKMNFILLAALLIGIVCGTLDHGIVNQTAHIISKIFIRLLQILSLPVIFFSIVSTLSGTKSLKELRFLGQRTLLYTCLTTFIAALIGLCLFKIIAPSAILREDVIVTAPTEQWSFLWNLLPSNFLEPFLTNNVIAVALCGAALGIGALYLLPAQTKTIHQLFSSLFSLFLKLTQAVVVLLPLAVCAFSILLVKDFREQYDIFKTLTWYVTTVITANLIQGLIILPCLLWYKKISPFNTCQKVVPALTMAFFSKSSSATLPVTLECAEEELQISSKVARFSLPLCTIINMNGCAAFILITVLFVSSAHGIVFSIGHCLFWVCIATIAAIGNAGVPMGCFFLTTALLTGNNIPLTLMGLILPFYTFLDMIETTLNVWSDICIASAVDKDSKRYKIT